MSVNPTGQQTKGLSELWKRLRFVLFAVIVYRIGTHIPIPVSYTHLTLPTKA